jgi:sigma-E factor negative regulatory protein RseC
LNGHTYHTGDAVRVEVSKNLGMKAVALGYVYPFLVLMAVLVGLISLGMAELKAGMFSLLSLVPYYLLLFLFRNRIDSKFTFSLKKTITVQ